MIRNIQEAVCKALKYTPTKIENMQYDKQQKSLTFEMKSVGDAWMEHVEKNHNADAFTPSYLTYQNPEKSNDNCQNLDTRKMPSSYYEAINMHDEKKGETKEAEKELEHDKCR